MSAENAIAQLIAGEANEPTGWLLFAVGKAALTLAETVSREAEYPKRDEIKKQLERLRGSVANALEKVQDFDLQNVLLESGLDPSSINQIYHTLSEYAGAVDLALTKYPARPGRNKIFPTPHGLSPIINCALWISIIWQHHNGQPPPFTNPHAQSACENLWVTAGGEAKGHYSTTARWRDHFREASESLQSIEANFIRRSLAIG